jgi:hypothetical protein
MISKETRQKAHTPEARAKAVATYKRNRAAKKKAAAAGVSIPLDAVGGKPRKKYKRAAHGDLKRITEERDLLRKLLAFHLQNY